MMCTNLRGRLDRPQYWQFWPRHGKGEGEMVLAPVARISVVRSTNQDLDPSCDAIVAGLEP